MNILGISCFYHDSAAALIQGGQIIAAMQEERFTRIKHDSSFPRNAILNCLKVSGLKPQDIDAIVFYEKPFIKFERLVETYLAFAPKGFKSFTLSMPLWLKEKLFQKKHLLEQLADLGFTDKKFKRNLFFSDHHLSHAASAFYPSPFEKALILTMDGVGEWTTTSVAIGEGSKVATQQEIHFPHSLGLLYSAFTYYCGFKVNSGEYKLMGLAPYGRPIFRDRILNNLIDVKADGSYRLNMDYFDYCVGLTMTNDDFDELFGYNFRTPDQELKQVHMDLAASIQSVLEEIIIKMGRHLRQSYGISNLCLAGGVALNCVVNGALKREKIFDRIWIQPAAGDAGGALGAALAYYYNELGNSRRLSSSDTMRGAYLGPQYSDEQIESELQKLNARFEKLPWNEVLAQTAQALAHGKGVGWFQGAMEFGPRALGNRSILANPQTPGMQRNLNLKVKFRESFRPFAPAVLYEDLQAWFEFDEPSPYMLMVAQVKNSLMKDLEGNQKNLSGLNLLNVERSQISAVTHVDGSARLQTVHKETNPKFHDLITEFKKLTGCSVLVNTSFNVRGEPIAESPADAYRCFMGTNLDILVVGNFVLRKEWQDPKHKLDYKNQFAPD